MSVIDAILYKTIQFLGKIIKGGNSINVNKFLIGSRLQRHIVSPVKAFSTIVFPAITGLLLFLNIAHLYLI
jgi:hypothetical protein